MAAHPPRWRRSLAIGLNLLALFALSGCGASVAETASAPSTTAASSSSGTNTAVDTPKCIHGCERWGKRCNIDPRGVYKCQRVCEKFGEICE